MRLFQNDWLAYRIAFYAIIVAIGVCIYQYRPLLFAGIANSEHPSLSVPSYASSLTSSSSLLTADALNPVRLVIPSIGVNANVQWVGIGVHGNLAVPTNYTDVAWYRSGPLPGEEGDAVIDGHVDNGWGLRAVFVNLNLLKPGDLIYVTNGMGSTTTFKVISSAVYDYQSAPTEKIFGQSPNATGTYALNLITCAGSWIPDLKTNDKRLVVYTEKVDN